MNMTRLFPTQGSCCSWFQRRVCAEVMYFRSWTIKVWGSSLIHCFSNKVLLKHSRDHSFRYFCACFHATMVKSSSCLEIHGRQNQKHFLSGPSGKSLLLYLMTVSMGYGEGNGTPLQYSCLEIPWTEEPGRLQSMGSWRVGHDWVTSLSLFTFMHWRRKWRPTPAFLPGEWGPRDGVAESDTTEVTAVVVAWDNYRRS